MYGRRQGGKIPQGSETFRWKLGTLVTSQGDLDGADLLPDVDKNGGSTASIRPSQTRSEWGEA